MHIATQKEDVSVHEMVRRSEHATTDIS